MSSSVKRFVGAALAASTLIQSILPPMSLAGGNGMRWNKPTTVERLAEKIDKLERHIDEYGTVVSKQPDVWSDGRLSKHRIDVENQLKSEVGNFQFLLNATVSETDSAFLGEAIALQAVANAPPLGLLTGTGATQTSSNPISVTNQMIPMGTTASPDPSNLILRSGAATTPTFFAGTLGNPTTRGISIEPYAYLDQKNRYLQHLNHLRRMNESDDTSDSPGYSLNLVRFPVSVLPGRKTSHGYGAEITITATPYLSEQLLPDTVRGLVISDVTQSYANLLVTMLKKYTPPKADEKPKAASAGVDVVPKSTTKSKLSPKNMRIMDMEYGRSGAHLTSTLGNVTKSPEMTMTWANDLLNSACSTAYDDLDVSKRSVDTLNLMEVSSGFRDQLNQTYKILSQPSASHLWSEYCNEDLYEAIIKVADKKEEVKLRKFLKDWYVFVTGEIPPTKDDQGNLLDEDGVSAKILEDPNAGLAWLIIRHSAWINEQIRADMQSIAKSKNCPCVHGEGMWLVGPNPPPEACEAFNEYVRCRWPVIVFALDPEIEEQNIGSAFSRRREVQLAAAIAASRGIISLQKLTRFVRRMELDVATVAVNRTMIGFSHGNDTFGWRFQPRIQPPPSNESNLKVIARDLIIGGPSRENQLKHTKLEPGIRECSAVVLMPSFVPYVTFDTKADWYRVDNPDCCIYRASKRLPLHARVMNTEDSVELSREITDLRSLSQQCVKDEQRYREGEVYRLMRAVDQLDRSLPMQTVRVQFPFDGDLSPVDLFERGQFRIRPRLEGWFGQPGILFDTRPNAFAKTISDLRGKVASLQDAYNKSVLADGADISAKATAVTAAQTALTAALADPRSAGLQSTNLFLVGKHLSLLNMRIIAGGIDVTDSATMVSRNVCQVTIPTSVATVTETNPDPADPTKKKSSPVVDVHIATPNGVTSRLVVPAIQVAASTASSTPATSLVPMTVSWDGTSEVRAELIRDVNNVDLKVTVAIQDDKGATVDSLKLVLGGEAEGAFGYDAPTVQFAAIIKGKTDTNSKGVALGPITLPMNGGKPVLAAALIGAELAKKVAELPQDATTDMDLVGYLRFSGGAERPTYKVDKSVLLRLTVKQKPGNAASNGTDAVQPNGAVPAPTPNPPQPMEPSVPAPPTNDDSTKPVQLLPPPRMTKRLNGVTQKTTNPIVLISDASKPETR